MKRELAIWGLFLLGLGLFAGLILGLRWYASAGAKDHALDRVRTLPCYRGNEKYLVDLVHKLHAHAFNASYSIRHGLDRTYYLSRLYEDIGTEAFMERKRELGKQMLMASGRWYFYPRESGEEHSE